MKRLYAAAILTALLVFLSLFGFFTVKRGCESTRALLNKCESEYKDGSKKSAAQTAADLKAHWEKTENRLSPFINRDMLDQTELAVNKLLSYCKSESDENFYAQVSKSRLLLKNIIKNEKISFLSVF